MVSIICAFIFGGCLCATFQVVGDYTKAMPPRILIVGIALGAFLASLGLTSGMAAFGGGGYSVMLLGFGDGVYNAAQAAFSGNWLPATILFAVVVVLFIIGLVCGSIHLSRSKKESE